VIAKRNREGTGNFVGQRERVRVEGGGVILLLG